MLLGNAIIAFTDHHNITFNNQAQHALYWHFVIEEFGVPDALTRLPIVHLLLRRAQSHFEESYLFYPVL